MATQYQNTLNIGRYIVHESLSENGTFSVRVEDTKMKKESYWDNLSLEQFDKLIELLSSNQNSDVISYFGQGITN